MQSTSGNKKTNLNKTESTSQKKKSIKRHVLSSDDEDDIIPATPKPKQKSPEKRKLVNPLDIFGSEPVKQSAIKVVKPIKNIQVII